MNGYKITEFELPKGWNLKMLSDTGKIISGGTPDTRNSNFWNGDIAWCTPTDITKLKGATHIVNTERKITEAGLRFSSATLLPEKSLVICTRATIGDCAINLLPISTNQGFKSIVPVDDVNVYY